LAALAAASPTTIAAVVGVAAAVVLATTAVAMKLTSDEAGDPAEVRPVAGGPPGAAVGADDAADAPAAEPPVGAVVAGPVPNAEAEAEKEEEGEEDEEEEEEDDSSEPTPTPPPTYDASLGSVDKSAVNGLYQSLTFHVQMDSTGPRAGVVVTLAITVTSDDTSDWRFHVEQVSGAGWTCLAPDGVTPAAGFTYEPDTTLTCSYEFSSDSDPPPLEWDLSVDENPPDGQVDGVSGSVQLSVKGGRDPDGGNNSETF
jgi:hypothetical protein